ncbi:MFS transporter [Sphingomonas morindae]|uniref:MFS transporter n=1 Tax=Sphingomonas morindae TaxID=1541170 RepID=A0ABY4X467_9SPHN|nr:MFS transporter [Sphingomonas morindae]USI71673.1 MFS transporter [Sphingomonas morindae]
MTMVRSESRPAGLAPAASFACALACGAMVANIYYAQPLIALIAPALGLRAGMAGLIVTLTQLGYAAGLVLLVPLADLVENRRLIVTGCAASALALAGVAASQGPWSFLVATVAAGLLSSGAQIVVPYAASLAAPERRGQTVGNVMAGLLTGIMLARPAASFVASLAGWRAIFWLSAAAMLLLAAWMARTLPRRAPPPGPPYGAMLRSLVTIVRREPALRRRAAYQGLIFAIFNLFWTSAPLMLAARFGMGQKGIALFGLAGAAGALVAPYAGRLGDRGHVRAGTGAAILILILSCLLSGAAAAWHSLAGVILFALTLDGATQLNQVLGQRVIYSLPGEARGRINAAYMTVMFLLGATGSAIATTTYQAGGWWGAMAAGTALAVATGLLFLTEFRR